MFLRSVYISQLEHLQVSLIKKMIQDVISNKSSNCYTANIIFRKLMLSIDIYAMISCIDKNFSHPYQNIMIMEVLQIFFGDKHLGGGGGFF